MMDGWLYTFSVSVEGPTRLTKTFPRIYGRADWTGSFTRRPGFTNWTGASYLRPW